ncbi:hypothetical protein BP5796_05962 [Coleophoma crateriformis]|uniref:Transcription factor CBF/NF-Y/archaeal histone domain-containing protein n=1 Tax=Coleophoma crateriformis TaxID=565419 RepID=A0A3D8RVZ3_9HELO|nr:hypothetical protein BP5796_05962 [Coleophoma crateriformis]
MSSPSNSNEKEKDAVSPTDAEMNDPQDPHASGLAGYEFEVKEQDRWLPIANDAPGASKSGMINSSSDANIRNFAPVARIMKTALPENAKIAKEAKECMQECVSEFISFITSEASEKCHQEKRKTVNGEDILFAMTSLGFENYAEALKIYLSKYRETQSARGENQQNRPNSQGFGSTAAGANPSAASTGATFQGGAEGSNSILGGQQAEGGEHDPNAYGGLYAQGGHNGAAGDNY